MNNALNIQYEIEIPAGYKTTEVGVIPEDWKISEIGTLISDMRGGAPFKPSDFTKEGIMVLPKGAVVRGGVLKLSESDQQFCTPEFAAKFSKNSVTEVFTIVVLRDLVPSGPSIGLMVNIPEPAFYILAQGVYGFITSKGLIANYLIHYSNTFNYRRAVNEFMVGSTQVHITNDAFKSLKIPLPIIAEQIAIARVLSDTDALIASLEQLIAKKKAIKTATIQQLLTGRSRLAQFSKKPNETLKGYKTSELGMIPEDWEAKPFGELFESSLHRRTMREEEIVSFVGMQGVSENAQLIKQSLLSFSEVKGGFTYFEKGDVLVAKITPCFENGKGCHTESLMTDVGFGSTEFHVLRAKNSSHSKFIYYWTTNNNLRKVLESEMVGSAGHRRVPLSAIKNYLIPCPQTKVEQSAIAAILSDIDAELATLQQKLAKVRDIKQGMMQQLLTGRIRLPLDHQP